MNHYLKSYLKIITVTSYILDSVTGNGNELLPKNNFPNSLKEIFPTNKFTNKSSASMVR